MPITIVTPPELSAVGPGTPVRVSTDLAVVPQGSVWRIFVGETAASSTLVQAFNRQPTHESVLILGTDRQESGTLRTSWVEQPGYSPERVNFSMTVQLSDSTGVPIETTERTIKYVPNPAGVAYVTSLATSGTVPVNPDIEVIKQAVTWDIGGVIHGVSELLSNIHPSLNGKTQITPDRTGSGSLNRIVGPVNTAATGIAWQVMDRKPGLGISEGAPDRGDLVFLELRAVQLLADGTAFTDQHLMSSELDGVWAWGLAPPHHIDYWIIPGVTMRFWWLQPGFPPNWQTDDPTIRTILRDWKP